MLRPPVLRFGHRLHRGSHPLLYLLGVVFSGYVHRWAMELCLPFLSMEATLKVLRRSPCCPVVVHPPLTWQWGLFPSLLFPLNIQPVVVMRGLKRQQAAASTNFVGCFLLILFNFFFSLLLLALNDLTGPSAGPLAQITYSFIHSLFTFLRSPTDSGYAGSCGFSSPIWLASFAMRSPLRGRGW